MKARNKVVRVCWNNTINNSIRVTIPFKIARNQGIHHGDKLVCSEDPCGGIIYRKMD